MSRLPGKKLRTETFMVDGRWVGVDVRILDDGRFYAYYAEEALKFPTMEEMRAALKPLVETANRLQYEPIILITCHDVEDTTHRWHNGHEGNDVELLLGFAAGWKSTTAIEQDTKHGNVYRWVHVATDEDATEVERPATLSGRDYGDRIREGDRWVPFTAERWRALHRVRQAMIGVRGRIAEIMADDTGRALDAAAAGGGLLLLQAVAREKGKGR